MKTCYPKPCDCTQKSEWRESGRQCVFFRCCGEHMQKIIKYSVYTCEICGSTRECINDRFVACKMCNKSVKTDIGWENL